MPPIALDATYSIGDDLSGVGLYSRQILEGLAHEHPQHRFDYYYRPHRFLRALRRQIPRNARRRLLAEPLGPRRAALFHGLNQRLPAIPLRRAIATFHDLFVLTGEYSTPEFRERFAAQARDAAERADRIIAVSAFTRDQVVGLLNVPSSKVAVVHHGIRELSLPNVPRENVILNVGALQKRKNIARLVEAFEAVGQAWRLVLLGADGFGAAEIHARIEASRARERILVPGYVTPERLAEWYARARVFAFPSLDEGFGMPVLEAMKAGAAVLTSNRSALPEIAGDAAVLVDPEDTEAIAGELRRLTSDENLRSLMIDRGRARAAQFSWRKTVGDTWGVYGQVLDGKNGRPSDIKGRL